MTVQRDTLEYDVVIVGAGPAGLAAACRLRQEAATAGSDISVCVLEKGTEVGAHIISGAVLDTRALDELFPDWLSRGAPVDTVVSREEFFLFRNEDHALKWPNALLPRSMHNRGNYVISLGKLCRWLGQQAESLGVEIYPGFAAQQALIEDGVVRGVITGDHGVDREGRPREGMYTPGIELRAQYTLFAEGSRGHIGRQLQEEFHLRDEADPQHYAIGLKEIWEVDASRHEPGRVMHGVGWPLDNTSPGGGFLYHLDDRQVAVGLVVDLAYRNPHLSPFDEFQRYKQHPLIRQFLNGGERIAYGARAITKGGYNSLPKMVFPGGAFIGCELGTLNVASNKGIHTAMKSGMLAADALVEYLGDGNAAGDILAAYPARFRDSWLYEELYRSRNFGPAIHRFGTLVGGACNFIEQTILAGRTPFTLHDKLADHAGLLKADEAERPSYSRPDGKLGFDRSSSVYLCNTHHVEDQPVHLTLSDPGVPIDRNLPLYDEPAQRYCPAGVYEVITTAAGESRFQINAQNCIHCKVCDIKDPSQNIIWVAPEGGSGPNYPAM